MSAPKTTEERHTDVFAMRSVFDKATALARTDGDIAFLRQLVGVFLQDAAVRVSDIHTAIAQEDSLALELAAHSLKAAAADLGATTMSRAAQRLEAVAHDLDLAQADAAVAVLEAALEELRPALDALLSSADDDTNGGDRMVLPATAAAHRACTLVIDDDPTVRLATRHALRMAGFDVLEAETGEEGLRMARAARPDIILLDVVMPGESGLDVCRRVKGDPMLADTPVLMASAQQTSPGSRADGLDAGADGYIVRPVDNQELVAWVRALLRVKAAEAERGHLRAQLRQAQKLEAIGRLTGGIAHDFNNHLMVMKGYLQFMLKQLAAADPCRADAERVAASVDKCARLVGQLLTFSRREPLTTAVVDLNELLNEMVPMLRLLLGEQIQLRVLATPGLDRVRVDRQQLEQVLMNLVRNARDAMVPAGDAAGGTLTLKTAAAQSDTFAQRVLGGPVAAGPYVMLAVSDDGRGMPPEVLERIFEPFFTTKEVGKGTGLGLATVFGIVKQHGAYIACDSTPGRGTTFRLYFPNAHQNLETTEPAAVARPESGQPALLVVEDEPNLRDLLVYALNRAGYRVHAAANAAEALAALTSIDGAIDALVTDFVLHGDSGADLARRLKESQPDLGVLFISGYLPQTLDLATLPGARFLQKPFDVEALLRTVAELVGR